jgi:hypothetical protein
MDDPSYKQQAESLMSTERSDERKTEKKEDEKSHPCVKRSRRGRRREREIGGGIMTLSMGR